MQDGLDPNQYGVAPKLTDAQKSEILTINREIAMLADHPGWYHLKVKAEKLITQSLPNIDQFDETDAVKHASKLVYIAGIKALLRLPEVAVKDLQKLESSGFADAEKSATSQ